MNVDPLADRILRELATQPGCEQVVLGGYFALRQYVDYRNTHDIDAWWKSRADPSAEAGIRAAMRSVATDEGLTLSERRFGETLSFELNREKVRVFSFQIAVRSVQLEPPQASAWAPILIETFNDNIGSKMNALVDRGSPRDFTDIHRAVASRLVTAGQCWELWGRKNPRGAIESARQKVLLHLNALEQRRPLQSIADEGERQRAAAVRNWFHAEFCRP